ncbi:hypothetical protein ACFE04_027784 [Oxalis oulophora]
MGSKREEERNEKIIRGLMKLPPNRRCINCNTLGPQYVCTNFWTFVCITCSGIHREFTHRVKSVSMANFTSQEVEALQNGGNQRAREIYLKDWDSDRQRLPNPSIIEKVREFIKTVYVDKKYAVGRTFEKPPRDMQGNLRGHEDETRRASSYHSYSQSPPYDHQYEERRYGKQSALTRKPGSDRGIYVGKLSTFIYSPGRSSEHTIEDQFANEGSVSRVSDYSTSSIGDPFRSGAASPNSSKEIGFNSPQSLPSDVNYQRDTEHFPHPQRTNSLGSMGSFGSNSVSLKSQNSFVDVVSEPNQASAPVIYGGLDLFETASAPPPDTSASSKIDLFQLPATSPAPSFNLNQSPQTHATSSTDLFAPISPQPSLVSKLPELSNVKNEGWATFETSSPLESKSKTEILIPSQKPNDTDYTNQFSFPSANMQWPSYQNTGPPVPTPSMSNQWDDGLYNVQVPNIATNTQLWNAFGGSNEHFTLESLGPSNQMQQAAYTPSPFTDQNLNLNIVENSGSDVVQRATSQNEPHVPSLPSHTPSMLPLMGETPTYTADCKSTNPFDLPYNSDLENSDTFLSMSSLQSALPNDIPSAFLNGVAEPWFAPTPVASYVPPPQGRFVLLPDLGFLLEVYCYNGGLAYMAAQPPNAQLPNVPPQGPVASIGGNPFA